LQYIADSPPHPSLSVFELKFPTTRASALQALGAHLDALKAELQISQRKVGNGTKLKIVAVINAIASVPGVYLPWKEMVALCRERGILTVVDAAHSIGQEPNINLSEADPDFWVSVGPYSSERSTNALNRGLSRTVTSGFMPVVHAVSSMCRNGIFWTPEINHSSTKDNLEICTSSDPLSRPLTLMYLRRSKKDLKNLTL